MYHYISTPPKSAKVKGLYTTPKQFEWQLKSLLKQGFHIVTFEDIEKNGLDSSKKNIVLTFDDGSECFYKNALPILKKYNAKAVLYPVIGRLGDSNVAFEESANQSLIDIVDRSQLLELSNSGIEIGSHIMDHIWLTRRDETTIKNELSESKRILEDILGKKVVSVAYPYGDYNEKVIELTREAGYKWGVITESGSNINSDSLKLKRYSVKGNKLSHYFKFRKILKKMR